MANKKQRREAEKAAKAAAATTEQPNPQDTRTDEERAKATAKHAAELRKDAAAFRRSAVVLREAGQEEQAARLEAKAEENEAQADATNPKPAKAAKGSRPTCTGTKKDGTPCTAKAKEGSELCVDHQPALARLSADERTWLVRKLALVFFAPTEADPTPTPAFVDSAALGEVATWLGWAQVRKLASGK